jgi:NAD(P)H-flavin reductase
MEFYHAGIGRADAELTLPCRGRHASILHMQRSSGRIQAHTLTASGCTALRIRTDEGMIPAPGQPLMGHLPGSSATLRTPLFPSKIHADGFTNVQIPSSSWTVGTDLDLLGPLGKGFAPPKQSQRWFLMALGRPIDRLFPLVDAAVGSDVSIVIWAEDTLPDLPVEVEVATSPEEVVHWADYLALDLEPSRISDAKKLLGIDAQRKVSPYIEVLLDTQYGCGLGVCSVCAVKFHSGWKLACQDGPVFHIKGWVW